MLKHTSNILELFNVTKLDIQKLYQQAKKIIHKSTTSPRTATSIMNQDGQIFSGCSFQIGNNSQSSSIKSALSLAVKLSKSSINKFKVCLMTGQIVQNNIPCIITPSGEQREIFNFNGLCLVVMARNVDDFIVRSSCSLFPIPSLLPAVVTDTDLYQSNSNPNLQQIMQLANHWLTLDHCQQSSQQVQSMIVNDDFKGLAQLFNSRISFGTAGLRSKMGPGYKNMNYVTVQQTAQGVASFLRLRFSQKECKERGVIIGYDARFHSKGFAEISAAVFAKKQIRVKLFEKIVATPLVPFAVIHDSALAGIMVTASHNPKQDNGYKLYWENGAQIKEPIDKYISQQIQHNLVLENLDNFFCYNELMLKKGCIGYDGKQWTDEIEEDYFQTIVKRISFNSKEQMKSVSKKIVYTAMHGVGYQFVKKLMERLGVTNFGVTLQQRDPDPNFPTVVFPNPQQGKGALKLSIQAAEKKGASVIIANDPDADRMALAERKSNGQWKIFTGDQIGYILANYLLTKSQQSEQKKAFIASTVSSKLLKRIGEVRNIRFEEVLTGFKWISNKAIELQNEGYEVILGYEEAIGFSAFNIVRDKDGISAMGVICQLLCELQAGGGTLQSYLEQIYKEYGYFVTQNKYFICHSTATIKRIFDDIRNDGKYIQKCGDEFNIVGVRDLTIGYDSQQPDKKPLLPVSSSTQMITLKFENGAICTLRTSGTEPKIKYYCEYRSQVSEENGRVILKELVQQLIKHLLKPDENQLIAPSCD